ATSGNELATFLLGNPSSALVDQNIDPAYSNKYWAVFLQDDWKLTSRLTLNLGLRWDYEAPIVERFDRQLRGFDFNAASPIAARAPSLNLKGAVLFAGLAGQPRGAFDPDRNNFQPRAGVAYRIGDKWVVRAGYGLYFLGQNEPGAAQGFSQRTNATVSTDGNLTPAVSLTNPFANLPGGRLLPARGNSQGASSFLGEALGVNYLDRPLPYSHQYSFDIERELPGNMLVEAAYVGNVTRRLPLGVGVNILPASELGRRTATGAINTAYYTDRVPNPMAGLIPNNAALNGATIPRQQLLMPYPQYGGIGLQNIAIGSQRYDGFQAKLTKRYSSGLSFLASYGIGKTLEAASLLNAQDFRLGDVDATERERRSAGQIDIPQKFTIVALYELPFGKGKRWGSGWARPADLALGGWQINFDITRQKGWTLDYPNAAQVKPGSAQLSSPTLDKVFDTSLWIDPATGRNVPAQEPFTLRTFPTRFGDVRIPGYHNWDASVSKLFPVREALKLQFRFEMINAFNHPWFTNPLGGAGGALNVTSPNFGKLEATQRNLPRFLKLALVLSW
ncbi:MAG: TonB-dependent receptor domain-containing protein, partial [Bryobacteraceae bacterium]